MKKNIFYLFILILLVSNFFLIFNFKQCKKDLLNEIYFRETVSINDSLHNDLMENYYLEQIKFDNTLLCNLNLRQDYSENKLSALVGNNNKFVFVAPVKACGPCYDGIIKEFGYIIGEISKNNFIIIVPEMKYREFKAYFKNRNYDVTVYSLKSEDSLPEIVNREVPYFFILTPDLLLKHIFIPKKEGSGYFKKYFKIICKRYF